MNPVNETYDDYKVAFFTNTYLPFVGGVSRSVDLYRRYLARFNTQTHIYAPEYDAPHDDGDDIRRLPAITHFNNTDFSLPLPIAFKPMSDFHAQRYDIVHVHHPFLLGEMGMRLARRERLPLVFTYHTQYEKYTHYVPVDHDTAARTIIHHATAFCRLCDLVIAPTADIRHLLESRGVQTPIEVLPTGVDLASYTSTESVNFREKLGISCDAPILLYVGRLAFEKNLEFLIQACLRVLARHRDAYFLIAGDRKNKQKLETLAMSDPEVGQRVHFLGRVEGKRLTDLYCQADLFVFASLTETQGMVILEAMAGGTPVVCLDADGVRDIVRNGQNGYRLSRNAAPEEFAEAVSACLSSPQKLSLLGECARKTAGQFDMQRLARRLQGLYRTLKLRPNHRLNMETMSFGLIRSYFETVWEQLGKGFTRV
jgi:1,2-diacylglycerol 3-alpha-glucosyltransferase